MTEKQRLCKLPILVLKLLWFHIVLSYIYMMLHLHDITDNQVFSVVKLNIAMKSIKKYCTIKETIYLLRGKRFCQLERVTLLAACFTAEFLFCFLDEYSRVFNIRYQEKKKEKRARFLLLHTI